MTKIRIIIYVILLGLLGITLLIYNLIDNQQATLSNVLINIFTEIVGVLLGVAVVETLIYHHEQKEYLKKKKVAFSIMRYHLGEHLSLLFNMYKASVLVRPDRHIIDPRQFFSDKYANTLKFLDLSKNAPILPSTTWLKWVASQCQKFSNSINEVLYKYSVYLEPDLVDLMERMRNTLFLNMNIGFYGFMELDKSMGFKRSYDLYSADGMEKIILEHTDLFCDLIDEYNKVMGHEKEMKLEDYMWANNTAPKIGSARLNAQII